MSKIWFVWLCGFLLCLGFVSAFPTHVDGWVLDVSGNGVVNASVDVTCNGFQRIVLSNASGFFNTTYNSAQCLFNDSLSIVVSKSSMSTVSLGTQMCNFSGDNTCFYNFTLYYSCFQESANVSNQTGVDGSCLLNYSGSYVSNFSNSFRLYDGNTSTGSGGTSTRFLLINYSKPIMSSFGATWIVTTNGGFFTDYLPVSADCLGVSPLQLRVDYFFLPYDYMNFSCFNGSSWNVLSNLADAFVLYEESIVWDISSLYVSPIVNSSYFVPLSVYRNDSVQGFCNGSSPFFNVSYNWSLFKNNVRVGNGSSFNVNVVNVSGFSHFDNFSLECSAFDGFYSSGLLNSSVLSVLNSVPVVSFVSLNSSIFVNQSLVAVSNVSDLDNDSLSLSFEFFNYNSSLVVQNFSVNSSYLVRVSDAHALLGVRVKVFDGLNFSSIFESNISVSDSLPVLSSVSPSNLSIFSNLSFSGSVFDLDGDVPSFVNFSVTLPNSSIVMLDSSLVNGSFVSGNLSLLFNGSYSYFLFSGGVNSSIYLFNVSDVSTFIPSYFTSTISAGLNFSFNLSIFSDSVANLSYGDFSLFMVNSSDFVLSPLNNLSFISSGSVGVVISSNLSTFDGVYVGSLNFSRFADGRVFSVPLSLSIATSFGVPFIFNSSSWLSSMYSSGTDTREFVVSNVGSFNLSHCVPLLSQDFVGRGFVSFSDSNFSIVPNASRSIIVTIYQPSAGIYRGYFDLVCTSAPAGQLNSLAVDNSPYVQVTVTSAPVIPPPSGGGGSTTIIQQGNVSVQSFVLLNQDGSVNGYVSYSYPLDSFSKTFIVQSRTADTSSLVVSCRGDFCQYVSFSRSSFALSGFGTDFFTATVNVPAGVSLDGVYSYEVVLSEGLKSTSLVNSVHISSLSAWYSKFALVVSKGDRGFWFSLGGFNVPKLLLYLLIVLLVDGATMLLLPKGKFYSQNVVLILIFVSLITFGVSALLF